MISDSNQTLSRNQDKVLNKHRKKVFQKTIALSLSVVMVASTILPLVLPAFALETKTYCGQEEHTHSDACYTLQKVLICEIPEGQEETVLVPHVHTDACYSIPEPSVTDTTLDQPDAGVGPEEGEEPPAETESETPSGEETQEPDAESSVEPETAEEPEESSTPAQVEEQEEESSVVETPAVEEPEGESSIVEESQGESSETSIIIEETPEESSTTIPAPQPVLVCGYEEGELVPVTQPHVHTDACYEEKLVLTCTIPEHTHEEMCYSDLTKGVETYSDWAAMFANVTLTGKWEEDVITIAKKQLGYHDIEDNFKIDEKGNKIYYSRYGAWYGIPYGDWCAMFVSFCMYYAGIPQTVMPSSAGCTGWVETFKTLGYYHEVKDGVMEEGFTPKSGDLVFFRLPENQTGADHVGFVYQLSENGIKTIEGNTTHQVDTRDYKWDNKTIIGYVSMPENPEYVEPVEVLEEESSELLETSESMESSVLEESSEVSEVVEPVLTVDPALYPEATFEQIFEDGTKVLVNAPVGAFPVGTTMQVVQVAQEDVAGAIEENVNGSLVQAIAFDITFYNKALEEIQPLRPIEVQIIPNTEVPEFGKATIVHVDDEGKGQIVDQKENEDSTAVTFESDSFSIYVVAYSLEDEVISYTGETFKVTVTCGPEAKIPENAELRVQEILPDSEEYSEYAAKAEGALDDNQKLTFVRLFDITILVDGEEVQPVAPVEVKIELLDEIQAETETEPEGEPEAETETAADTDSKKEENSQEEDVLAMHFSDEEETPEILESTKEDTTVTFNTDGFSIYAIVGTTIQTVIEASDGNTYLITVSYTEAAGIPEGSSLVVTEILPNPEIEDGSSQYDEFLRKAEEALAGNLTAINYARFFDIKIVDADNNKVQIQAPVDVRIELLEVDNSDTITEMSIVHFADDSESGEIIEGVVAEDAKVSFEANGFSVYALVSGPLSTPAGWYNIDSFTKLDAMMEAEGGVYLQLIMGNGYYCQGSYSSTTGIAFTNSVTAAFKYYFEKKEGTTDQYYIYYKDSQDNKQYITSSNPSNNHSSTANSVNSARFLFTTNKEEATAWTLSFSTTGDLKIHSERWYWGTNKKTGASYIHMRNAYDPKKDIIDPAKTDAYISRFHIIYQPDGNGDPYGLDGKSYSLLRWDGGNTAKALTADANENYADALCAEFLTVMSRTGEDTDKIYVPNDTSQNITSWTFEWEGAGYLYKLSTTVNGEQKYLKIDSTGLSMVDNVDDASSIQVTAGTGIHTREIILKAGNNTLTYSGEFAHGFNVNETAPGLAYLYLAESEPESIINEYYAINSATKKSVSDDSLLPEFDGDVKQVIIYTRAWNGNSHRYTYFAVDGNGNLVPVTENGDTIEWIGAGLDDLVWDFTVYGEWKTENGNPVFVPNNYYELQNTVSHKYLAPLMPVYDEDGTTVLKPGQILSDSTIGIIMPGRRNGQYYSQFLVWDQANYAFAGIKVDLDTGVDPIIEACSRLKGLDFYFAIVEPTNPDDELQTVLTVDNNLYGIKMSMVNFNTWAQGGGCDTSSEQNGYLISNTFTNLDETPKLLSTNLEANGYPKALQSNKNLSGLYNGEQSVNHLFIQSIYDATGYFMFDSTQNFATLYKDGVFQNDFTVYQEIGTYDYAQVRTTATANTDPTIKPSLKHGQFFPYNEIHAGLLANPEYNGLNLYANTQQPLDEDDPRYNEQLYLITVPGTDPNQLKNQKPDYWFGMELEAGFIQTPSGLDEWGHDIIFEFSGDDDFWLYVDGELVIDLGGIHSALEGRVNFRNGRVYVNGTNTTLYDLFHQHYRDRGISEEETQKILYGDPTDPDNYPGIFEDKVDPEYGNVTTFKDNTNHTMKIFYMERGAGASNLYMRFNLSAVQKGTVQLEKELLEEDGNELVDISENSIAVYPYQIWYKHPVTGAYTQFSPVTDPKGTVTYLGTTEEVTYKPSLNVDYPYTDPVTNVTTIERVKYEHVYLVKPSETIEINFPTFGVDAQGNKIYVSEYYIVECGVDPNVFDYVLVNNSNVPIPPEYVSTTFKVDSDGNEYVVPEYVSHLANFKIDFDTLEGRAKVIYQNVVKETKRLTIQKELYKKLGGDNPPEKINLYDEHGEPIDPNNPDLLRTFDFRLSFKTPYDEQFSPANIYSYHVIDPAGYYCRWLPANPLITDPNDPRAVGKFIRILHNGQGVSNFDDLTEEEQEAATFDTSMNGAVSQIPAYYLVEVVGLLPGTQYNVVERPTETPDGYQFWQYVLNNEPYNVNDVWDGLTGTIPVQGTSEVLVRNYKGYALRLVKVWADASTIKDRDPAYFAVYYETTNNEGEIVQQVLLADSVRQLKFSAKPQEILWSYLNLPDVTGFEHSDLLFSNYVVREVVLGNQNPTVDENGNVTNTGTVTPVVMDNNTGGVVHLHGTTSSNANPEDYELIKYRVEYDDPVEIGDNFRQFTVNNIPADKPPVMFYKEDWGGDALGGAKFTLYQGETSIWSETNNGVTTNERTSRDSDGWFATEFLEKNTTYVLTETMSPQGYYGIQEQLSIVLSYNETNDEWSLTITPDDDSIKIYYRVEYDKNNECFKVFIKNRPYDFQVIKVDKTNNQITLEGAQFELYKQIDTGTSTGWSNSAMSWSDGSTLVSDENGVIPHLDSALPAGKYQLREVKAAPEYITPNPKPWINFTVTPLGEIILGLGDNNDPSNLPGVTITGPTEGENGQLVYKITIPNEPITYELKLKKVDENGNDLVGSKFTLQKRVGPNNWVNMAISGSNIIDMTNVSEFQFTLMSGSYRLVETDAPNGYVIRNAYIYFTLHEGVVQLTDAAGTGANSNPDAELIEPGENETIYTIKVTNHPGQALPMTGGHGTLPYTLGGMAIITASCLMYGYRRRRWKGGPNKSPT